MERILIIGCPGSGKSTIALKLHQIIGHQLIHLDQHFFSANWVEPTTDDWRKTVSKLIAKPNWIMEGNYGGTFDLRFPRADTIIYLDLPTMTCIYRVIRRTWKNLGQTRPDMQAGCKEKFSLTFLHYILTFKKIRWKKHMQMLDELRENKNIIILKNNQDVKTFLGKMKQS